SELADQYVGYRRSRRSSRPTGEQGIGRTDELAHGPARFLVNAGGDRSGFVQLDVAAHHAEDLATDVRRLVRAQVRDPRRHVVRVDRIEAWPLSRTELGEGLEHQ